MKKYAVVLTVLALAVAGLGFYASLNLDRLTQSPFIRTSTLNNVSKEAIDSERNIYVISDSQQKLKKMDPAGTLIYEIGQEKGKLDHRLMFSDIAVDSQQQLYVLVTELDSYGLNVISEKIIRYKQNGTVDRIVYQKENRDKNLLRVGSIKSLQIRGNALYFFISQDSTMVLNSWDGSNGKVSEIYTVKLPRDKFASEITGTEPGLIYYSTKRGAIYQVLASGESKLVYPLDGMDRTRRNFPMRIELDSNNRLHFIDQYNNDVSRLDNANPQNVETIVSEQMIGDYAPDMESAEIVNFHTFDNGALDLVFADTIIRTANDRKFSVSINQVHDSASLQVKRWLAWGSVVLIAVLILLIIRLVYVWLMKKRTSLMLKQMAVFIPIIVISMVFLSNFIFDSFSRNLEQESKRELSVLARNGKNIIDGDRLQRLTSPKDFMNDDYKAIRKKMNYLFEGQDSTDRRGLYSTLYKYENGKLFTIADDDDGVNMFKPFEITENNRRVLENGEIRSGDWEDAYGSWTYAIAPVYNSAGEIVGIYETGRDMNVLHQNNKKIYSSIVTIILYITGILLVIICMTTLYLLSPIRKLRNSVTEMANGNWHSEVRIRTRDEVAELGERFNYMARHIRKYIGDITDFSEASYRFVPQQFLQYLGKDGILDIHLGDQVQREMVVMVANIRSFYMMSKRLTPKENFNFMNSFLNRFGPIVRANDGLVNKYLGAGFMSLFPNEPEGALRAAIDIRKELVVYNEHRNKVGYKPVDIGIGIHRGPLMLGIIGEEKRLEGNVISDDVNTAIVLEKLTETLGVSILVTQQTLKSIPDYGKYQHRSLGRIRLEGQDQAIELYDVYEGDSEMQRIGKEKTRTLFEQAIVLYQEGRFYDAREAFVEVVKLNRQDKAAKLYFFLCDEYFQKGTASDWNGTLLVS